MRQVMDADDLARITRRIAHEIAERNRGLDHVVLLGIPTRGKPFADRIATELTTIEGMPVRAGSLDIGLYRDDIDLRPKTRLGGGPKKAQNTKAAPEMAMTAGTK